MNSKPKLGSFLKEVRLSRKIGLVELGKRVGHRPQLIWNWEHGRSRPSTADLLLIIKVLRVPKRQLIEILVQDCLLPFQKIFNKDSK